MKRTSTFLMLLLGFLILASCQKIKGKGDMKNDERILAPFTGVSVSMDCNVEIREPDTVIQASNQLYRVSVYAQENLLPYIETKTEGGILKIRFTEDKIINGSEPVNFLVTMPGCSKLTIGTPGTVTLKMDSSSVGQFLECENSGSGCIFLSGLNYSYTEIRNQQSGCVFCKDSGRYRKGHIWNSGAGNIDMLASTFDSVWVENTGSGSVSAKVNTYLNDVIKGSGNIYYKSDTAKVVSTHAGSGMLIKLY